MAADNHERLFALHCPTHAIPCGSAPCARFAGRARSYSHPEAWRSRRAHNAYGVIRRFRQAPVHRPSADNRERLFALHCPTHAIPCRSAPCARIAGRARAYSHPEAWRSRRAHNAYGVIRRFRQAPVHRPSADNRERLSALRCPTHAIPCRSAPCARFAGRARSYSHPEAWRSRRAHNAYGVIRRFRQAPAHRPSADNRERSSALRCLTHAIPCRSAPCARIAGRARAYSHPEAWRSRRAHNAYGVIRRFRQAPVHRPSADNRERLCALPGQRFRAGLNAPGPGPSPGRWPGCAATRPACC